MEDPNRDILLERLAALEQTVSMQNRVGLVGLLAFVAMSSIGWLATRPSKDLDVHSIVLRDKVGTVRTRIDLGADGSPHLTMFDHKGVKLLAVGQTFQGSSALTFYDEGERRMQLASLSKGVSSLRFMNDANEIQSAIFINPKGGLGISFASANDGIFLGLEGDGKPGFRRVDIDRARQGRPSLAPEDLERFALPTKGQPGFQTDATRGEAQNVEPVGKTIPQAAGTSASLERAPDATALAMSRGASR